MKKYILYFINLLPIGFWIGVVFCDLKTSYLFFLMPIVFAIINCLATKTEEEYIIPNTIFAFVNAAGCFSFGIYNYIYISPQGETLVLSFIIPMILIYYICCVSVAVFYIKKIIVSKKKAKSL